MEMSAATPPEAAVASSLSLMYSAEKYEYSHTKHGAASVVGDGSWSNAWAVQIRMSPSMHGLVSSQVEGSS